jgi:hypothetical protein
LTEAGRAGVPKADALRICKFTESKNGTIENPTGYAVTLVRKHPACMDQVARWETVETRREKIRQRKKREAGERDRIAARAVRIGEKFAGRQVTVTWPDGATAAGRFDADEIGVFRRRAGVPLLATQLVQEKCEIEEVKNEAEN